MSIEFTKTGNIELTELIKIDGFEYNVGQVKKVIQHGLRPSIEYDVNISYAVGDVCSYNGKMYVSLQSNNLGNLVTNETYWKEYQIYSSSLVEWNNSVTYNINAWVSYEGNLYKSAVANNKNHIPSADSEYWTKFISGDVAERVNITGVYNNMKTYMKNDVVRLYGALWICKVDNTVRIDPPEYDVSTDNENANWVLYLVDGQTASIRIGTTTTVDYDVPAEVTNTGNPFEATLNFKIPRGYDGKSAYDVWVDQGHEGTVQDFFTWLKDNAGTYSFTDSDLVDGVLTIPLTSGIVGIIDNTGLQWQLPQGSVLKGGDFVKINMLGIMSMKNLTSIPGTWYVAVSGGVRGDSALSFEVGEVNSVPFSQGASITTSINSNGVVTFNMNVPRGKDALTFQVGTVTASDRNAVYATTDENGVVTLDFELIQGVPGINAFTYIAYASDNQGSNFSLTPNNNLKYRAEIQTTARIDNPVASDFANAVWVKYIGDQGPQGKQGVGMYVYVAYAEDNIGTGFSFTPTDELQYRAEIHSKTEIVHVQQDHFTNATWVKYLGDKGDTGGVFPIFSTSEPSDPSVLKNGLIWIPI